MDTKPLSTCTKSKYRDENQIQIFIDKFNKTKSKNNTKVLRGYLCEKCTCWHLTSLSEHNKQDEAKIKALHGEIASCKKTLTKRKNIILEYESETLFQAIKRILFK